MKIAVGDNNDRKFIQDLIDHWEHKGHEVRYELGASEYLAQWADLYYVDQFDSNIHYLYKIYNGAEGVSRTPDWDNNKKPIIVCRALDWDVWVGQTRDQKLIDWIDKVICIAPHIEQEMRKHAEFISKLKMIRPGVNLDKFTLKKPFDSAQGHGTDGFQLGMVLGDMWWPKNHMAGLDIFTTLYRQDNKWRLHIRGQHEGGTEYWKVMYEHFLESRNIKEAVTLYPQVDDMNAWYENIDILLHPSMKEAFCYAVAEAMAKNIDVVINDFYGSRFIWANTDIYRTHEEAIKKILEKKYHKGGNRGFIEHNFSLERQLKETDEWLGL